MSSSANPLNIGANKDYSTVTESIDKSIEELRKQSSLLQGKDISEISKNDALFRKELEISSEIIELEEIRSNPVLRRMYEGYRSANNSIGKIPEESYYKMLGDVENDALSSSSPQELKEYEALQQIRSNREGYLKPERFRREVVGELEKKSRELQEEIDTLSRTPKSYREKLGEGYDTYLKYTPGLKLVLPDSIRNIFHPKSKASIEGLESEKKRIDDIINKPANEQVPSLIKEYNEQVQAKQEIEDLKSYANQNPTFLQVLDEGIAKSSTNLLLHDIPYAAGILDAIGVPKYPTIKEQMAQAYRDTSTVKKIAGSASELIGDLPMMALGGLVAKGLTASLPVASRFVPAVAKLAQSFGAFAAPTAVKKTAQEYQKLFENNPKLSLLDVSFGDYVKSAGEIVKDTAQAGTLGMFTSVAEPILGAVGGTAAGKKLLSYTPTKVGAELLAEGSVYEAGKAALEGRLPTTDEIVSDMALITGARGVRGFLNKYAEIVDKTPLSLERAQNVARKISTVQQMILNKEALTGEEFKQSLNRKLVNVLVGLEPDGDLVSQYELVNRINKYQQDNPAAALAASKMEQMLGVYYPKSAIKTLNAINDIRDRLSDVDLSADERIKLERRLDHHLEKFEEETNSPNAINRRIETRIKELDSDVVSHERYLKIIDNKLASSNIDKETKDYNRLVREKDSLEKKYKEFMPQHIAKKVELLDDMISFMQKKKPVDSKELNENIENLDKKYKSIQKQFNLIEDRINLASKAEDDVSYKPLTEAELETHKRLKDKLESKMLETSKEMEELRNNVSVLSDIEREPLIIGAPENVPVKLSDLYSSEESVDLLTQRVKGELKKLRINRKYVKKQHKKQQREIQDSEAEILMQVNDSEPASREMLTTDMVEMDDDIQIPKMEDISEKKNNGTNVDKKLEETRNTLQKILDSLNIESRFKRAGATETGFRSKLWESTIENSMEEGYYTAKKIVELLPSQRDRCLLTMFAERDLEYLSPEQREKFEQSYRIVRDFFDKSFKELNEVGALKNTFQENNIKRIDEEIEILRGKVKEASTPRAKSKLLESIRDLKGERRQYEKMQFVHIPFQEWFAKAQQRDPVLFRRKLNALTSRKRSTLYISDLIEEGLIDPASIDIIDIIGNYSLRKGADLAAYNLLNAGLSEGVVSKEPKPGYKRLERGFSNIFQDHYLHPSLQEFLDPIYNPRNPSLIRKILNTTKFLQFYDMIRVPVFDLTQLAMVSFPKAVLDPIGTARSLYRGVKDARDRTPEYKRAMANGLNSTLFHRSKVDYMKTFDNLRKSLPEKIVANLNPFEFIRTSSTIAWEGDKYLRSITNRILLDRGYEPRVAAQVAARFHGDYPSLPKSTRQLLNTALFTGTFKMVMLNLYSKMLASPYKIGKSLIKEGKIDPSESLYFQGLVGTAMIMAGLDAVLTHIGFDREVYGYRYYKRFQDENGEDKELVFSNSNPANLPVKLVGRAALAYNKPGEVNRINAALNTFKWEIHPLWRTTYEIVNNKNVDGGTIFKEHDPEVLKNIKRMIYALKKFMPISEAIFGSQADEDKVMAAERLDKELGQLLSIPSKIFGSSTYIRNPFEYKMQSTINGISSRFNKAYTNAIKEGQPLTKKEIQYYIDELERAEKDQKEYLDEQAAKKSLKSINVPKSRG